MIHGFRSNTIAALFFCLSVSGLCAIGAQACPIAGHSGLLGTFTAANATGSGTIVYFDFVGCRPPSSSGYPYSLQSVSFSLVDLPGAQWPVTVDIVVFDRQPNGHACYGPGTELYRQEITCDRATFEYPAVGTATIPGGACLSGPAYAGVIFTDPNPGVLPSMAFDDQTAATCTAWQYDLQDGRWREWTHYWSAPLPGNPMITLDVMPDDSMSCDAACFTAPRVDLDGNGIITISDATFAVACQFQGSNCPYLYKFDLNADCVVTPAEFQEVFCALGALCVPPWWPWGPVDICTCDKPFLQGDCRCLPGDADGSKIVNISDAVYLIAYIFAGGPAPQPDSICSGDPNGDCVVSISDAVFLINYIFTGGAAPPNCLDWAAGCGAP